MAGLATVNLGNPQMWRDPTMSVKHGKLNRRSNNTAHHARKTRVMIPQCAISGQHGVKSFNFIVYGYPTCQMTKQHPISARRIDYASYLNIPSSKIFDK